MKNGTKKLTAVLTLGLMLAAVAVQAAEESKKAWTSSGSAGTIQSGPVRFHLGLASRTTGMPDGTAILRYNIVATDGLVAELHPGQVRQLDLRYRAADNGRVRVFVKEAALDSDRTNTLVAFDSDNAGRSADTLPFMFRTATAPMPEDGQGLQFNFAENVYYLEVWLTKQGNHGIGASLAGACISVAE